MPEQIIILLSLTVGLFDKVPLVKVAEGVKTLRSSVAKIPSDAVDRLTTADKLSDADRKVILDIATAAMAPFQPPPPPQPAPANAPPKNKVAASGAAKTPSPKPDASKKKAA
jgi:hypothetical protein